MGSQVRVLLRPPWFPLEPRSSRGLFYFYFLAASQPISPTSKYSDMRALFISAATGVKPGSPKNRVASLEASRPYFSAIPLWPFADRGFPVFSPLSSIELYRVPESRANKRSPSQTPMPYSWGILCKRPDPATGVEKSLETIRPRSLFRKDTFCPASSMRENTPNQCETGCSLETGSLPRACCLFQI